MPQTVEAIYHFSLNPRPPGARQIYEQDGLVRPLHTNSFGVKKAVLRPETSYILVGCPVISVDWLGPTPRRICGPALLGAAAI